MTFFYISGKLYFHLGRASITLKRQNLSRNPRSDSNQWAPVIQGHSLSYSMRFRSRQDRQQRHAVNQPAHTEPLSSQLSRHMVREMRSDHAGETGAVYIYQGITAVARWRQDAELLAFAKAHGNTEAEHLRLLEAWLPAYRPSRLLVPWRLAGWRERDRVLVHCVFFKQFMLGNWKLLLHCKPRRHWRNWPGLSRCKEAVAGSAGGPIRPHHRTR